MQGSGRVLQHFFALRVARGGAPPPRVFYKRLWTHAENYLRWCAKQGIDEPLAFLNYRFECGDHACYEPKIHQLRSVKLALLWREWQEGIQLQQIQGTRLVDRAGTKQQQLVKELRILTVGHETAKQHYLHRRELCLAETAITGGFHPNSRFCPSCLAAPRCVAKLYKEHGFDVVALRAGRLRDLPVEVAAAAVR